MVSRNLHSLLNQSKTISHLHQLHTLIIKTSLNYHPHSISLFTNTATSISITLAHSFLLQSPISPPLFACNTIIRAYSKTPQALEAFKIFKTLHGIGLRFDKFTYPFVVKACGRCSMIKEGQVVHCLCMKEGLNGDHYVRNTLLSMYASCGEIGFSRVVFDEMPERDVVSWTSMITAYVDCNRELEAIAVFREMSLTNVKPNSVTLLSLLCGCSHIESLTMGKSIHAYVIVSDIELDVALGTAILEMYSKCGDIESAIQIFGIMKERNLQTWTIMISGLANHGRGEEAVSHFVQMEKDGLQPDSLLFSAILSACSHLGLVDDGCNYFDRMVNVYSISPTMEHYGCMVDLFGRAGMVEEAYNVIKKMPRDPNSVILRSFISACNVHGKVPYLDKNLTKLLLDVEPSLGANHVLAANMSAASGRWDDEANARESMKEKGLKKVPGHSFII